MTATLASRVNDRMDALGLDVAAVVAASGLSKAMLYRILRGEKENLDFDTAKRLSTALSLDVAILAASALPTILELAASLVKVDRENKERLAAIVRELYAILERLGADEDLLSIIGSWRDTMTDEEVLALLKDYNVTGKVMHSKQ